MTRCTETANKLCSVSQVNPDFWTRLYNTTHAKEKHGRRKKNKHTETVMAMKLKTP